ncbi:unnamed protein product [Meloidogyne enterolobii]|uniref:Uncharacterized protein n=1 Tax=Meloidogyne enterolobii TaxID=390850 RepID=A0ACB0YAQ8_MELEN
MFVLFIFSLYTSPSKKIKKRKIYFQFNSTHSAVKYFFFFFLLLYKKTFFYICQKLCGAFIHAKVEKPKRRGNRKKLFFAFICGTFFISFLFVYDEF